MLGRSSEIPFDCGKHPLQRGETRRVECRAEVRAHDAQRLLQGMAAR